jgi:hypothetical protein
LGEPEGRDLIQQSGRRVGRHAQVIPTLNSMADQYARGGCSHVGSADFERTTSAERRRPETTVIACTRQNL